MALLRSYINSLPTPAIPTRVKSSLATSSNDHPAGTLRESTFLHFRSRALGSNRSRPPAHTASPDSQRTYPSTLVRTPRLSPVRSTAPSRRPSRISPHLQPGPPSPWAATSPSTPAAARLTSKPARSHPPGTAWHSTQSATGPSCTPQRRRD
ncbi:hypothetical protein BDY21DRAFT_49865 [Lineolata rhizophorae]|uniref:Uncharacterized protein n=1 Tax=Lineolata rhizophorae TaxID=578093 RepID=A0A6A6NXI2_9PEZI|nr:hypothetical protein BDY21DRAFT_49865 [Lineolata rhizophorae]